MLCLLFQRNKFIRAMMAPRTGIFVAIGGVAGLCVWVMLIFGPLYNDFTLALQFAVISGIFLMYFILVRRRLGFADVAFASGGASVSKVRSLVFRAFLHAVVLGVYISGWNLLYVQLIDLGTPSNATKTTNGTNTNATSSADFAMSITATALPKWVKTGASGFSDELLRQSGRLYMIYNLYLFSQMVKTSMQISVAGVTTSVMIAARYGMPVKLRSNSALTERLKGQLPSVFIAGHFMIIVCILRAFFEAIRRFSTRRQGVLHNLGSIGITVFHPLLRSINSHGICYMEVTGPNLIKSSCAAFDLFRRTGMDCVINDDILFGARLASNLAVACTASTIGSMLVGMFGFPATTTVQVGNMCFYTAFATGNWGMEASEAWVCTQYLEFAEYPESIYICNPDFANHIHSVLFGCDKRIGSTNMKIAQERKSPREKSWLSNTPLSWLSQKFLGSAPLPPANKLEVVDDTSGDEKEYSDNEEVDGLQDERMQGDRIQHTLSEDKAELIEEEKSPFLQGKNESKSFIELQMERKPSFLRKKISVSKRAEEIEAGGREMAVKEGGEGVDKEEKDGGSKKQENSFKRRSSFLPPPTYGTGKGIGLLHSRLSMSEEGGLIVNDINDEQEGGIEMPQVVKQMDISHLIGYGKVLLVLKVELDGKTGEIELRQGQNLRKLALDFCAEHALDPGKVADPLEMHLQRKLVELDTATLSQGFQGAKAEAMQVGQRQNLRQLALEEVDEVARPSSSSSMKSSARSEGSQTALLSGKDFGTGTSISDKTANKKENAAGGNSKSPIREVLNLQELLIRANLQRGANYNANAETGAKEDILALYSPAVQKTTKSPVTLILPARKSSVSAGSR